MNRPSPEGLRVPPGPNCARSRGVDHAVFFTSPKRERGKLVFRPSLALRASVRPCAIRVRWLFALFVTVALLAPADGACAEKVVWLTGLRFEQRLDQPSGGDWTGIPLRRTLATVSRTKRVAILLDRRVDPGQPVNFTAKDIPLGTMIRRIASQQGLGVSRVGPILYVGPTEMAQKLATLVELRRDDVRSLPPAIGRRLVQSRAWQWPELSTPRELIDQLAGETGIRFYRSEEQIPHDLWPAGDFPPLGFAERVSLLAAGFGFTFEFSPDGSAVRFIPAPVQVALTRQYEAPGGTEQFAQKLAERFPDSRIRALGQELEVVGRYEDHDQIARILRGEPVRRPVPSNGGPRRPQGETAYTIKDTEAPAGLILKQLAPRLGLKLRVDPRVARQVQQRVRVDVQNVSRDDLLKAVVQPLGLTFSVDGDTLEIRPGR